MLFLRIFLAFILLGLPLYLGFAASSPFVIFLVSLIFLIAYIGGKWPQWCLHWQISGLAEKTKNLLVTYAAQFVLVSVLFFLGLGIGKAFNDRQLSTEITNHELTVVGLIGGLVLLGNTVVIFLDKNSLLGSASANETTTSDDDDLTISDEPITEDNFFRGLHFSVSDHSLQALRRWSGEEKTKVKRIPTTASKKKINETEKRLGFKLPEKLRRLYRQQNGGLLPAYWVPAKENPSGKFEDWIDAFAHDYDDLRPLDDLAVLMEGYMENFDPEYDDESEKEDWFPDADKFVVLTQRYGVATLLDYRENNAEPGVLLVNLENEPSQQIRKSYDSFSAFFEDLRKEDENYQYGRRTVDTTDRNALSDESYNPDQPERFWANATSNASRGISDKEWSEAEKRLGGKLPHLFKSLYMAMDGGSLAYPFHPDLGTEEDGAPRSPFKGKLYSAGGLMPLDAWVSLTEFSDRLDFMGEKPYSEEHAGADKLVVIAASYDSALMLDYRDDAPSIVYCRNLTDSKTCIDLDTPEIFLKTLRRRKNPYSNDPLPMPDERLSPRVMHTDAFWIKNSEQPGASSEILDAAATKFGAKIPDDISTLLETQNGGQVRFRFAPPVGNRKDNIGGPQNDWTKTEWKNMFPGGIWPVENWKTFSEFRQSENVALQQDFREDLMPEMSTEPDVTERLIVVGMGEEKHITLLDLSESYFSKTPYLARADYDESTDAYQLTIAPISVSHYTQGVLAILRAKISELN